VNGLPVIADGKMTNALPGKVLINGVLKDEKTCP
jgi:hypothetical protein